MSTGSLHTHTHPSSQEPIRRKSTGDPIGRAQPYRGKGLSSIPSGCAVSKPMYIYIGFRVRSEVIHVVSARAEGLSSIPSRCVA